MLKRMILCKLTILAIVLTSLPVSQAQTIARPNRNESRRSIPMQISSYEDDPFVRESIVQRMDASRFNPGEDGRLILSNDRVQIENESYIYKRASNGGEYDPFAEFKPFAWNPWPWVGMSNLQGDFRFPNEARFPLFKQQRDADGKIILKDGLQVWTPNDLHLGMTTAFNAANAVIDAGESWAGRDLLWGQNGRLEIETQVFTDFNAFYSPSARMLFFGVVPYRLKGETNIKIFETATSWDLVAHESGHAVLHTLKPNVNQIDHGFNTWGESFADQMAMWASLRNPDRVQRLLAETNGNLNQSNSLTRLVEAFAALIGKGTGLRDAFQDMKISDTMDEVHDRSQVLTGAAYKLFLTVYSGLKNERGMEPQEALGKAGEIMGTFLARSTDYTPENQMTLEDVAKAYLKVDKEFFDSRYHNALVDEFTRREIFDANSEHEWLVHEDSLPYLYLPHQSSDQDIEELLQANVDVLGIWQGFGLKLQSVIREESREQTIVRVQLTLGRGDGASLLKNEGIFVFRADGLLADYHTPLPPYVPTPAQTLMKGHETVQLRSLISQAKRLRLDQQGAPLSIVCKADGQWTVESRVLRGEGLNTWMEVFTPENPRGERREVLLSPLPPDKRIPIPDDLIN